MVSIVPNNELNLYVLTNTISTFSDFGFWRDEDGKCVAHGVHPDRPRNCKDKFTGRSGYKKISKSVCEGGIDLSKDKEWECGQGKRLIIIEITILVEEIIN
jgi:hypothetical protein